MKLNKNLIQDDLDAKKIQWHFIPARSPHFGGLWEAAVKAFKAHFYKTVKGLLLTFEQALTLVIEIEAILNSRPLTSLSSNPDDPLPLCPSHFMIGDSLVTPVEESFVKSFTNRLSSWQHIQKVKQHFWQRWYKEYLHQLQVRTKWHCSTPSV